MHGPLFAADRGVVVYAGWNTLGFGNLVVIDHGNGWQTVYGHLSRVDVGCGETVQRGGDIGLGGSTGGSTGPHLHFEMIFNGLRVDPIKYLP
jgi:murein DD-endopeptidase MepM/ murein hydrolase activator NlpD